MISLDEKLNILMGLLDNDLKNKFVKLIDWFKHVEDPIVVSFSGGVDSSVVLAVACIVLGSNRVVAVTAVSPIRIDEDIEWAKRITSILGVRHIVVEGEELKDTNFVQNPSNRCYICKKHLARKLIEIAKELNAKTIIDGTNASDLFSYRPGLQALIETGIRSPLAEVGISKDEARAIAKVLGLPNWERPPASCLATRIPYGETITVEKLRRIAIAEKIVKEVLGVKLVRVRDHGYIARIEVGRDERSKFFNEELMDIIALELKKLGYKYVTLDLLGYRSGSMDDLLPQNVATGRS